MIAEDYKWFVKNQKELFEKYGLCFLAIKDRTVLGTYPTYAAGIRATQQHEALGSFIVQECTGDESAHTNYIASTNFC